MWVPKSWSPRANHWGTAPYAASSRLDAMGLVGAPPALSLVHAAAQGVEEGVEVGTDAQPEQVMSSPVLPMTVTWLSASAGERSRWARSPRRNRAPPTPPARAVMRMAVSVTAAPSGSASGRHLYQPIIRPGKYQTSA